MFSCVTNVKQKYQEKRCFIIGMKSFLDISSVPDLMPVTEDVDSDSTLLVLRILVASL